MKPSNWINYLSSNRVWTKRLMGLEEFYREKTLENIEREFEREKYGELSKYDFKDLELYKLKELELAGIAPNDNIFVSFGESIFEMNASLARLIWQGMIYDAVKRYGADIICELGCGYGYNFSYLKNITPNVYGGEFSINAIKIAEKLGQEISKFNFYNGEDYKIIRPKSVILSVMSIHYLKSAQGFINELSKNKEAVDVVINFEPLYFEEEESFLDILKKRYLKMNDYNTDFYRILTNRQDIEILELKRDYIGMNPLLPVSLIIWKFK